MKKELFLVVSQFGTPRVFDNRNKCISYLVGMYRYNQTFNELVKEDFEKWKIEKNILLYDKDLFAKYMKINLLQSIGYFNRAKVFSARILIYSKYYQYYE